MSERREISAALGRLFTMLILIGVLAFSTAAQTTAQASSSSNEEAKKIGSTPVHYVRSPSRRELMFYQGIWGVDELRVKQAESGELIKFTWRVVDPIKAKALNDKKLKPILIDLRAGVQLVVPTMEKVGQLRQASSPEAGKSYWMAFSNTGRPVKRGDRVNVVIGQFKAEGLVVE
jgi:hypothetical protein